MSDIDLIREGIFRLVAPPTELLPPAADLAASSYAASEAHALALARAWERIREEVDLAMDRGLIPGAGIVFAAHPEVLQGRVLSQWGRLAEQPVLDSCVALIAKLHDIPPAAALCYEFLKTALVLGGHTWHAERVADMAAAYYARFRRDHAPPITAADDGGPVSVSQGTGARGASGDPWGTSAGAADAGDSAPDRAYARSAAS